MTASLVHTRARGKLRSIARNDTPRSVSPLEEAPQARHLVAAGMYARGGRLQLRRDAQHLLGNGEHVRARPAGQRQI